MKNEEEIISNTVSVADSVITDENSDWKNEVEHRMNNTEVQTLMDEGFGYGEGTISYRGRVQLLGEERVREIDQFLETPGAVLTPISIDSTTGRPVEDDGCGDGRGFMRVLRRVGQNTIEFKKSLDRPKVFGGGATMAAASEIGLGKADGKQLQDVFRDSMTRMGQEGVDFGAHSDNHAHGENCGCGAIDKAPQTITYIATHRDKIEGTLGALSLGFTDDEIKEILNNYEAYANTLEGQKYSGKKTLTDIEDEGKIVKELYDDHDEMFVLLNTVRDTTINQQAIRDASDGEVMAFGVDVWRMEDIAGALHRGDEQTARKAFLGELVYTLGVSAVLTKGDLPVKLFSEKPAEVPATA